MQKYKICYAAIDKLWQPDLKQSITGPQNTHKHLLTFIIFVFCLAVQCGENIPL